ncbi:MAG: type II secretion system protein [Planctomycetota bacterium]
MCAWINKCRGTRGFTIVELLIVIAVIIMLMSILIVAVNAATRTAQGANTRSLMSAIKQGLVRFKGDIGYLPPVLGDPNPQTVDDPFNHDLRKLYDPRGAVQTAQPPIWGGSGGDDDVLPEHPDGTGNGIIYVTNIQDWYSVTSLAEYLLGYGHHQDDGYGYIPPGAPNGGAWEEELPPLGIRDPGSDGVWGATIYGDPFGAMNGRMQGQAANIDIGKVHGPYIDLKDERMLAGVGYDPQRQELIVLFPGDSAYDPHGPKTIVDYWGNPMHYYRRLYAPGDLRSPYRRIDRRYPEPTLSDVFLLRPYEVDPGNAIDSEYADAEADTTTVAALNSAEFGLFSPGPDRAFDPTVRYDAIDRNNDGVDFSNEDNIVELGP